MEYLCQHCNNDINANFCSNCGQKRYKRIDRKYVFDEIQYSLIHTNKGFLYSVKNIIQNPGKTAREFIIGDRVNHYKPLLLVFVLSGISTFLSFKVIGFDKIMTSYFASQHLNSPYMNDMMSVMYSYYSFLMLFAIPFFAFATKIAFNKWGQNYYEHIIMNSYIVSFYTIFSVVVIYPILFLLRHNIAAFIAVSGTATLIVPVILVWFFKNFYRDISLKTIISRVLLVFLLLFALYFILIIIVVAGGFAYAIFKGPEALEYMMPPKA